jgi:hypothetical protein
VRETNDEDDDVAPLALFAFVFASVFFGTETADFGTAFFFATRGGAEALLLFETTMILVVIIEQIIRTVAMSQMSSGEGAFDFSEMHNELRLQCVREDLTYIFYIFDSLDACNVELHPSDFRVENGMYNDPHAMYRDIELVIREMKATPYMLEFMPYIDDYMALFF